MRDQQRNEKKLLTIIGTLGQWNRNIIRYCYVNQSRSDILPEKNLTSEFSLIRVNNQTRPRSLLSVFYSFFYFVNVGGDKKRKNDIDQ